METLIGVTKFIHIASAQLLAWAPKKGTDLGERCRVFPLVSVGVRVRVRW